MSSERVERKLAAILAADVAGYSRLMGMDEEGTHARLKAHRSELIEPKIGEHRGRVVKTTGDGLLVTFASVVDALRCAVEIQREMARRNTELTEEKRIDFRVGINVGDIMIDGDDILGDGVNIAARLETIAEPGGICISGRVHEDVRGKLDVAFDDLGEQQLKNIAWPVRALRVRLGIEIAAARIALALPDKPSIAVLPFQNMSGDPDQEYFADGIAEEIITALSRFRELFVIARNSSFTFKGRTVDVKQIGRELGVRYVLDGSVRKAGNRVRITGQLADAQAGTQLWADRFDGGIEDIFELQDRVTASVIGAIAPKLEQAEIERATRKPTERLDAYDFFLRGLACVYQTQYSSREANAEALRLFTRAIELDPGFASAYAWAADCYTDRKANGWVSDRAADKAEAERLSRRAVQLGSDNADALNLGGWTLAYVVQDLDAGSALVDRALALNQNLAVAWFSGGWLKIWMGAPEMAIERFAHAMRLSPVDPRMPSWQAAMAHANYFADRYDEGSTWSAMALRSSPDFQTALRIDAACNALAGRLDRARQSLVRLCELHPLLRLSNLRDVMGPYRRQKDFAKYEEGMRRAGLPA